MAKDVIIEKTKFPAILNCTGKVASETNSVPEMIYMHSSMMYIWYILNQRTLSEVPVIFYVH